MSGELRLWAPDGVPEIGADADLARILTDALANDPDATHRLADGDVVAVTSKVVSKAEGRVVVGEREHAIEEESVRVVARTGATRIVRTRHGLTMAAAGVDASNVAPGRLVLLPIDPDASARRLREALAERGLDVGVIVTDTAGRAWREGQTDLAIGVAGLHPLHSFAGRTDGYGNDLMVTAPAVADEIAGAAELAQTKLGGRPFAVLRGLAHLVLPRGEHGPGARALVRAEGGDLFGYGAREAVIRALGGDAADRAPFGAPASAAVLIEALAAVDASAVVTERDGALDVHGTVAPEVVAALAFAHGWESATAPGSGCTLRPPLTT